MENIGIANVGIASVAAITVICYLVGLIVKASGLNDKYIPICCGVAGAVSGAAGLPGGGPSYCCSRGHRVRAGGDGGQSSFQAAGQVS